MFRSLTKEVINKIGETVLLQGWVHARRDMGKVIFLDLRDRSGIVQVVVAPTGEKKESGIKNQGSGIYEKAKTLRPEFVISIKGVVNKRPEKMINPNLPTGKVEIVAVELEILNEAKTPPFEIDKDTADVSEELRLKYRYLDLRSERMKRNLVLRDKVIGFFREYMHQRDFLEIETPILVKGTPEGAREFIVPSRLHSGKFYVLPQSPQQFKQLCMVAGAERYFQIARCFRDEDQRGDRQPEFTQLDFEMSFVEREDILRYAEGMFIELIKEIMPEKKISQIPFPRLSYSEAMEKYDSDKPDLRQDKNNPNELAFCWVLDFPMFKKTEEGSLQAVHHPFCAVFPEDISKLDAEPLKTRADAYDLVLNGYEIGSGSVRIHKRDLQSKIFKLLGLSEEETEKRFGHMLEAFEYGAPPHGGFAPGIDRLLMILANEPSVREVIAFPKTGDARDLLMGAPSELPEKQLKEAHIKKDV